MKLKTLLPGTALSMIAATPAFAAEGEGGILSPEGGLMFWTLVVFGIVLLVLYKLAFPYILGAVEAREQRIRELLAAAARDREEAQTYLVQQQKELEETRARTQEILAESRTSAERAREELLVQTRREQEEIISRTRRDLQREAEQAIDAVRREAVDLAIAAASRLLEQNLDRAENRRLVERYLEEFEAERVPGVPAGV